MIASAMARWLGSFVAALVVSYTAHASILEPISKSSEYVGRTDVQVDLSLSHPVSDLLYGVFFEEVSHCQYLPRVSLSSKSRCRHVSHCVVCH